jgi:uncharacterized SAM-binding protein YcdF (DUF218 family)
VHKLLDHLYKASNSLLMLAALGIVLALLLRRQWAVWLAAVGVFGIALLSVVPVGEWLLVPLENRFPPPGRYPERVDGIVVVSDRINLQRVRKRDEIELGASERFLAMFELAHHYPEARIVLSGIGEATNSMPVSARDVVQEELRRLGFDDSRVIYEDRSMNVPIDFARNTMAAAQPRPGERWLLVTSAATMPRTIGAFWKAGWDIDAWPVGYLTDGDYDSVAPHMRITYYLWLVDVAMVEWLGMARYWWAGWTDAPFPGPALRPTPVGPLVAGPGG